ncbi:hypothetical protein MSL71_8540 [Desulfoluna butyratoxydans]|uniref:Uncharacterized protein n=1 Tax=Desulfoluna butyratoxydans TaxID=231438 RepID=A0A4U8YHZ0_9BACT|nr:hypothetical protein MSL71_8540 [Desulfoluna butyratoxydans]
MPKQPPSLKITKDLRPLLSYFKVWHRSCSFLTAKRSTGRRLTPPSSLLPNNRRGSALVTPQWVGPRFLFELAKTIKARSPTCGRALPSAPDSNNRPTATHTHTPQPTRSGAPPAPEPPFPGPSFRSHFAIKVIQRPCFTGYTAVTAIGKMRRSPSSSTTPRKPSACDTEPEPQPTSLVFDALRGHQPKKATNHE